MDLMEWLTVKRYLNMNVEYEDESLSDISGKKEFYRKGVA
jgi:hypothetical protein